MDRVTEDGGRVGAFKRLLLFVLLPLAALMAVALGIAYVSDIPVTDLMRDPSAVLDGPWYVGVFSTTGIALWASTAAMCLLALSAKPTGQARSLLIAGAVVSLVLGADDGYLFHETVKNGIGIPSPVTIGLYGVIAVILFARAWRYMVERPDFIVIVIAVVLLVLSAGLDALGEAGLPTPPFSAVIEDVAKFLGIATWATFFAWLGRDLIRQRSGANSLDVATPSG